MRNQRIPVTGRTSYSAIKLLKEYAYFDKEGYFDPLGINWGGEMATQRIGDLYH